MTDMSRVIEVDSTQLNADDLAAGPQTFTVSAVKIKSGKDQPVEISLKETDKFFRPCKTVCRVLVAGWGADSSTYPGKSFTLYCDPKVRWGGLEVGGLRVSHMSHLDSALTLALTVTRGSKKPYTVKPLVADAAPDFAAALKSAASMDELGKAWSAIPKAEQKKYVAIKDARKAELSAPATIGDRIAACKTVAELDALSDTLSEDDAGIYFDAVAKRKGELSEGGGL